MMTRELRMMVGQLEVGRQGAVRQEVGGDQWQVDG